MPFGALRNAGIAVFAWSSTATTTEFSAYLFDSNDLIFHLSDYDYRWDGFAVQSDELATVFQNLVFAA